MLKNGIGEQAVIDTPGAFPGLEAEERGQAEAIARNLFEMAKLLMVRAIPKPTKMEGLVRQQVEAERVRKGVREFD